MPSPLPLAGVKTLDVSSWTAAPTAAVVLGDFGADVVKSEPPGEGDPHRANGETLAGASKSRVNDVWRLTAPLARDGVAPRRPAPGPAPAVGEGFSVTETAALKASGGAARSWR